MQPCGVQPRPYAEGHDPSTSLLADEETGSSTRTTSETTSEALPESSSSGDHTNIHASPSAKAFTKSRARTMSSTMSFSAMFSQSPSASHSRNMSPEYSFFPGNRSRSDTSESAYSSIGSPVSDSSRFGLVVGSPFSISSDERYMLGTPSTPAHSLASPTKSTLLVPAAPVDAETIKPQTDSQNGKGKGKDSEISVPAEEPSAVIVADDTIMDSISQLNAQGSPVIDLSTGPPPISGHPVIAQNTRPSPLTHSNTYSGADLSGSASLGGRVSTYDCSGRSTPTAHSATSSMHSKISSMRIKLKRKGSSLVDVMSFKNQGTSRNGSDTPGEPSPKGARPRSGSSATPSAYATSSETAQSSSAQIPYSGSKKNLRTKIANKFDFSMNRSGTLQFAKKQTRPPPLSPGIDKSSRGADSITSPNAVNHGLRSRSSPGTADNCRLATPLSADSKHVFDQPPVSLGRVISESPIAIPLSPLSPPLLDTKHHARIDALSGSIPDFELLDSPPKSTSGLLINRGAHSSQRASYFDTKLPPELKIRVFATILELHQAEHNTAIRNVGEASSKEERADAARYLSKRWIGNMAGRRELFSISRVSPLCSARSGRES